MALCILLPAHAFAKDYYFPSVVVTVSIQSDGSFDVVEKRTYDFSGDFHWATYTLQKSGFSSLENFTIEDESGQYIQNNSENPGTYSFTEDSNQYIATFYYSASNEQKTFIFSYKINGGIKAYQDIADFYWKLVGANWDKKTNLLEAFVYLPQEVNPDSIYVFGHGPLQGTVERIDGKGAYYKLSGLPPNTFVEARVIFPSNILSMTKESFSKKDEILNEEISLANTANAQKTKRNLLVIFLALLPVLLFLYWLRLFFKYGKEYKPTREIIYEREIPEDLPPATVGYLLRFQNVKIEDFTATIMNLIRKGYIVMQVVKEERGLIFKKNVPVIYLTKTDKSIENLSSHEIIVYNFLFSSLTYKDLLSWTSTSKLFKSISTALEGKSGQLPGMAGSAQQTISTEDIKDFIRDHPKDFTAIYEGFKESVKTEGGEKHYFETMPGQVILFIVLDFLLFFLIFVVFALGLFFLVPIYIISSIVFFILILPLGRRTHEGADAYSEWNGLRKFLKDFSSLKSVIPASIVLWESYLVYSVTFGISKRVIEQMKVTLPNIPEEELRTSHFFVASSAIGNVDIATSFGSLVDSMVSSFNSISTTAASTGSGGGFSGGGGGGGGGSGGGAG
jgi:uncharacterized membrane protein